MNFEVVLFVILIIQFSVCHPISNGSSHCAYENDKVIGYCIGVDCKGAVFNPSTCDDLKENVNISSASAVSFKNCEIVQFSDILVQFPNVSKLSFSHTNTLPSADFSNFEHLSIFKSVGSELKTTPTSLSINAADLKWFEFRGNQKNDIASISMENATKLEYFNLRNTMVSSLPADLFKNSTNLKSVFAHFNEIENIDTVNWPNSVQWMDFSSNKIHQLKKKSFKNLTNLKILFLWNNDISEIETDTFSQLNNLACLELNRISIKEITKNTLKGLNNLTVAYFDRNDIHYIENGAFESTLKLFILILNNNNISSLNQQMFAGLNRLSILDLGSTLIRELNTESFGNLSQLRVLKMRNGILETIDFNAFAYLPKLGHVDLSENRISSLVKMAPTTWNTNQTTNNTFRNEIFEAIDETDIASIVNEINHISEDTMDKSTFIWEMIRNVIGEYPELEKGSNYGLKKLILSGNQLTEIEKDIFVEFKNLRELFLTENPIITLYPESFAGLNELELLKMDGCKLTSIDFTIFTQLTQLQTLNLSKNQLTSITAVPLPSIHGLYLNDNKLTDFPMKKSDFPNLKTFDITNNPLDCSKMDHSFADIEFKCDSQN